jgi:hypothetical protein
VSSGAAQVDRVRQLGVAAVELRDIGADTRRTAQLASEYYRGLTPLLAELNELIAGTSTGADKQLAILVVSTQQTLAGARAALDAATQRARRAEAAALDAARRAQRESASGGVR